MENEYWEYMVVVCGVKGSVVGSGGENITDILNRLGKYFWEAYATAVVKDESGATRIQHFLKRRIDPKTLPMLG